MTRGLPGISDSEWEVMKVLWARSPLTANEVIEQLEPHTDWHPKTIRSFLHRLTGKGAVGVDKDGHVNEYYPLVSKEQCQRAQTRSFLQRIYDGAMKPMLVHFLKDEELSADDIEELKRLLEDQKP